MWELNHKEGWVLKNWCFQTVVQEKTLESPLDCKEIKPVNPKGNQSWIYIRRTDAEAEATVLWPLDMKCPLIGKDPDIGKDERQKEKGMRWLDSIMDLMDMNLSKLWDSEGQGSLACWSPWGRQSQTWLSNWTTAITMCMCVHGDDLCLCVLLVCTLRVHRACVCVHSEHLWAMRCLPGVVVSLSLCLMGLQLYWGVSVGTFKL